MSTDESGAARAPVKEADPSDAETFRGRGFEPGEPIYEVVGCFTLDELQRSLFGSTYGEVLVVHLKDDSVDIPVVVTMVEARYAAHASVGSDTVVGCYLHPDWYVEGWVLKRGFDPSDMTSKRVRIFVSADYLTGAFDDYIHWQVIPEEPKADAKFIMAL